MKIPEKELLQIYKTAFSSRLVEEKLQIWCHTSGRRALFSGLGSELGASVITAYIKPEDYLVPRYRGFSAAIGKGLAPKKIFGEFLRKKSGTARGLGDVGSFHDHSLGLHSYSVILGANFGIAIGLGLAIKLKNGDNIAVCLFGDGEASRSTFGSALNLASVWKLPILFVCENNGISMHTDMNEMSATKKIADRAAGYKVYSKTAHDIEPRKLIDLTKNVINELRTNRFPILLEISGKRFTSHNSLYDRRPFSGKDIPQTQDPLILLKEYLIENGIDSNKILDIERSLQQNVEDDFNETITETELTPDEFYSVYYE